MAFTGTGGVWAMKRGDFLASNFPGTSSGLLQAADYIRVGGGGEMRAIGTINLTSPLLLGEGCLFRGWGGRSSLIVQADPTFSGSYMISNYDQAGGQQWCAVENMSIWGNKSGGATVPIGIYFKSVGQPSRIRDVSLDACSGLGIKLEGGPTNGGNFLVENTGVSNCLPGAFVLTGVSAGYTFRDINAEFVNAGAALIYIDGPSSSLYPATVLFDGIHLEGLLAGSVGVLIESARNVHIKDLVYFGSGNVGDLVKITGTASELQSVILENITAFVGGCANGVVDVTNGYTLAANADGVNLMRYEIGTQRTQGSPVIIGNPAITGNATITGNITVTGTEDLTGNLTARGAANNFGTSGTAQVTTVGGGGANAAQADLIVDSGNTGATQARWNLRRNGQTDLLGTVSGTLEQIQFRNALQFGTTAGAQVAYLNTSSQLRLASSGNPSHNLEVPNGMTIGDGSTILKVVSATATLDFDLTAITTQDKTMTVTGAAVGDCVFLGVPNGSVTASVVYSAWVSAANTVTVRADTLAVGENPASGTFRATVIQF